MSFNPNKLTFKVDEITGEIIQPKIFLCNRQLKKIGEIFPVNDLRIKAVLNGADEISFSTPKYIKGYNNIDIVFLNKNSVSPIENDLNILYDKLKDYSVILAEGFGYFEVSPTINDNYSSVKQLQGHSLGESELSQLFCTLECNTSTDMENFGKLYPSEPYVPTILYSEQTKYSLIHKILSYAPNYEVGHVDDTLKNIQRTFSFSNKDIISCFSDVAQEVVCIFDVVVQRDQDGNAHRIVNIYDAQYCKDCGKRNIVNGICQNCKSTNIAGIGEDTSVLIGTDNLSDEITLTPDGNMKNCFIIEGGDDIITDTVSGILPSGNNKLYLFSQDTRELFSSELNNKYDEYINNFNDSRDKYAELLELQYGILDLILYLQSGRMPTPSVSNPSGNTDNRLYNEVIHVISSYQSHFPNGLGLIDTSDTTSRNGMIRQVLSLFVDDGFAIRQENGNYDANTLRWTGDIIIYETGNSNSNVVIHVTQNSSTIECSNTSEITNSSFCIKFLENYEVYIKQMIAITTKNYEFIEDNGLNNPKEWQKYSLNRLYSYHSGYQTCLETLEEIKTKSSLPGIISIADQMKEKYLARFVEISDYMTKLEDIIYYLRSYYSNADIPLSSIPSESHFFNTAVIAFQNMVHYIKYGTWIGGSETDSTDHPIYCKNCSSTNVTMIGCNQCKSTNISSYGGLAYIIYENYLLDDTSLETQRSIIRKNNDLRYFLKKDDPQEILYKELCSMIREDVYQNSNFISDGLSNSELILKTKELIQKAEQELARACISQHTLSGNIYSFVAYSRLSLDDFPIKGIYDKFKLGNFMWYVSDEYRIDDAEISKKKSYKLRLSVEEFSWSDSGVELNVEFTDVLEYLNGNISDITSLMQIVGNLSTSFDSVKKQAEQGEEANNTFQKIKNEGLQSALSNVLNARNIDVQIDDRGITLRKYDYELDDYDQYQMKLINRNIVMTSDAWKTARMAIGLGRYNGQLVYGIWAELLFGDLIVGNELIIKNDNENSTVTITGDGIFVTSGSFNISGKSNQVIIDPQTITDTGYILAVKHDDDFSIGIKADGTAVFKGSITATSLILDGCKLPYEKISGTPSIPSDIKDLTDTDKKLKNIMYKGDITTETKTDSYGNKYTEHIVPNGTSEPIKYITYSTDSYVLFGKAVGSGTMGKEGTYVCISKEGLLQANNAIIYGTIYATDGEFSGSISCGDFFSVGRDGNLMARMGEIGGWKVSNSLIQSENVEENDETRQIRQLFLDSHSGNISTRRYVTKVDGGIIKTDYNYTIISNGGLYCRYGDKLDGENTYTYYNNMTLDGNGILYKYEPTDQIVFSIGRYNSSGNIAPYKLDLAARFNCPIYIHDRLLWNSHISVKTGTNSSVNTGGWVRFSVVFDKPYAKEPFVNVMPITAFSTENIMFNCFHGNSEDGFTGFDYSVYCINNNPDGTAFIYSTKWFAIGDEKPNV